MQDSEKNTELKDEIVTSGEVSGDVSERVYEVGYLLVPTLEEMVVPSIYDGLKELIISLGGVIVSDDMPKMIPLAYTMTKVITNINNKFNTAYFGWIKFTVDAEKVDVLKKKLGLDANIIRFLITKTVRENTVASKRFVRGDSLHRKPKGDKEEVGEVIPINKEEIDKEIEALVS